MRKNNILKLQNISKIYKIDAISVRALDGVSLTILKGEFVSIMGPSGSGKSTLMHIMGCLDTPTSGKVFFDGEDVSQLREIELAKTRNQKIGFVFQTYNLVPRITTQKNVSLPLFYAGKTAKEREKIARRALEEVNLEDRFTHFPNQLSGGEQQRVAIARALVNNPAIIFADEPTGNLDTKTGTEIMKIFQKLNQFGHTIVVVTHESHIAKFAKRIIKIKDGRILE